MGNWTGIDMGKPLGFDLYDPLTGGLFLAHDTYLDNLNIDDVELIEDLACEGSADGLKAKQWLNEQLAYFSDLGHKRQPKLLEVE